MTPLKIAYRQKLYETVSDIVKHADDVYCQNTDLLDEAVSSVEDDVSRNRSFYEIMLDDLMVAFEASIAGTNIQEIPYDAYALLYCARHGHGPQKVEASAVRLKKIVDGERFNRASSLNDTIKILPYVNDRDSALVEVIEEMLFDELFHSVAMATFDEPQLRSADNLEIIYTKLNESFGEMAHVNSVNLPVTTEREPVEGEQMFYATRLGVQSILNDFIDQAAYLGRHEDIERVLFRMSGKERNGRNFEEIVLDDALVMFEGSLVGSNLRNLPLEEYKTLYIARHGDEDTEGLEKALERLIKISRTSLSDHGYTDRYGLSYKAIEFLMADTTTTDTVKKQVYQAFINEMMTPFKSAMAKIGHSPQHLVVAAATAHFQEVLDKQQPNLRKLYDEAAKAEAAPDLPYQIYKPEDIGDWRVRMNGFVGLETVKSELGRYQIDFENKQLEEHFNIEASSATEVGYNNMVFVGNPGLGKTETARIVGAMAKEAGLVETGHVVVTSRKDLVGEYIGKTAQKTKAAIEAARGGVLLIDEAYSLSGTDKDFGKEALDTLVDMAPYIRKDTIVILAGYEAPMNALMEMNQGLASRFPINNKLKFENLTEDQLLEIAQQQIQARRHAISEHASEGMKEIIRDMKSSMGEKFGNARTVIDLVGELTKIKAAECKENGVFEKLQAVKQTGVKVIPDDIFVKWRCFNNDNIASLRAKTLKAVFEEAKQPMGFHRLSQNLAKPHVETGELKRIPLAATAQSAPN